MSSNKLIEISFTGENIKPHTVKVGEIADILKAIESMVESQIFKEHPEIDKEQIVLGLVNIGDSSIDLDFESPIPQYIIPMFQRIGHAVKTKDYSDLPSSAYQPLDTVISFTRKRQCRADFIIVNGHREILATITPETIIEKIPMLVGETTLYGQVVRVGGRIPKIMLETVDGQTIYCDADIKLATKLGEKLYRTVGLVGMARWDAKSLRIEQFSIDAVTLYEDKPLSEAMKELAKISGSAYIEIKDIDKYIANIRGSELE